MSPDNTFQLRTSIAPSQHEDDHSMFAMCWKPVSWSGRPQLDGEQRSPSQVEGSDQGNVANSSIEITVPVLNCVLD